MTYDKIVGDLLAASLSEAELLNLNRVVRDLIVARRNVRAAAARHTLTPGQEVIFRGSVYVVVQVRRTRVVASLKASGTRYLLPLSAVQARS